MYILFAQTLFKQNQFCYKTKKIYIGETEVNRLIFQFRIFTDKIKRLIEKMNSTPVITYI